MSKPEMLEVIDENDNVIGLETRLKIHQEGLLHREIHVWFFTPAGEVILQHRAKSKDTFPDMLDATVGGHVEPGTTYDETAVRECREETSVDINPDELIFLKDARSKAFDKSTKMINNTMRRQYAYLYYKDRLNNLRVENGKGQGFEAWDVEALYALSGPDKNRFIPFILQRDTINMFRRAKKLLCV